MSNVMEHPHINPMLYDRESMGAKHAAQRDDAWFSENRGSTWRVRPLFTGESPAMDEALRQLPGFRCYAVVIAHDRAGDKRKQAGRGIYPVIVSHRLTSGEIARELRTSAQAMCRWFRKSIKTPPGALIGGI